MTEFYSAKEVADRLGVHSTTVTRMVQRGDLPGHRIGKLTRIPVRGYEEYVERTRITPTPSRGTLRRQPPPEAPRGTTKVPVCSFQA